MAKEDLVFILKRLLQTDTYLEFLLQLDEADLRTLIACILSLIHISEPTRLLSISYAVFCLTKKKKHTTHNTRTSSILN